MGIGHNAIIISWGIPTAGREVMARELFASRVAYFEKHKKAGKIETWEPVILGPHGGSPAGFFIVRGTHDNMVWMVDDAEFQELNMRALYCLSNVAVLNAFSGAAVRDVMAMWGNAMPLASASS